MSENASSSPPVAAEELGKKQVALAKALDKFTNSLLIKREHNILAVLENWSELQDLNEALLELIPDTTTSNQQGAAGWVSPQAVVSSSSSTPHTPSKQQQQNGAKMDEWRKGIFYDLFKDVFKSPISSPVKSKDGTGSSSNIPNETDVPISPTHNATRKGKENVKDKENIER